MPVFKMTLIFATAAGLLGAAAFHAGLKSSVPARNAVLKESPKTITLTFTEGVILPATGISVLKADSTLVEKLIVRAVAGDTTVAGTLTRTLGPGSYLVKWRNGSADDGHVNSGIYAFKVVP